MRVDNAITLVVKDVGEREKFEQAGFTSAGLADDVDMAASIATEQPELMIDASEIG